MVILFQFQHILYLPVIALLPALGLYEIFALCFLSISPDHTKYRNTSNIRHTKYQNINDSRLVLQLSLPNPLKPGVKSRMKM